MHFDMAVFIKLIASIFKQFKKFDLENGFN